MKSSSTSKMNSPRVITTFSPLDEAIALLPQKDRRREQHPHQLTTVDLDRSPSMGSPSLGLRPVMEWGDRSGDEDEGDELVEGSVDGAGKVTTDRMEAQIDALSNDVSPAGMDQMTIPAAVDDGDTEVNAEADLEDEDAEGEQEEDDEDDDAEARQGRSSRSRTPPPPDPPLPGTSPDSNNDDPDADADAEGEMEFEENEELPPTSTSSATVYQTALSVPIGQVPQGNFGGSFFDDDGWLIVLWIQSDKSFGYNMTSTHVLISAMVPGSLPSSLSIFSDLSEKMTLRWLTPKPRSLL